MRLVSDPPVEDKIRKMHQRVRWRDPLIVKRTIDQTRFVMDDGHSDDREFSFLVVGDSGSGYHRGHNPQRKVAELLLPYLSESRFMLHTGDVIYLVGSKEFYPKNFIDPYREFLVGGDRGASIPYDRMTFQTPILPVPGNHDYYDLPLVFGVLSLVTSPLRSLFQSNFDLDVGWQGSNQGDAYARAFLDYLQRFRFPTELERHLDTHYTAKTDTGYCLRYQPGQFTRLPNRYYTFRYGGIDFFALDSSVFNEPVPLSHEGGDEYFRQVLHQRREEVEREKQHILDETTTLDRHNTHDAERLDDLYAKLSQLEEVKVDLDKQLECDGTAVIDTEQLDWLTQRLIQSWHDPEARGRVLFFHHPPYVTEASKWQQAQTLAIRYRLRQVLDDVARAIADLPQGRPLVDLVLNGHAHCLEYLKTLNTGHADSYINWIVCGGSGFSLRRQRPEGSDLVEMMDANQESDRLMLEQAGCSTQDSPVLSRAQITVARSQFFIGRYGHGDEKHRPYSGLRIDVKDGIPPTFVIHPVVADRFQNNWYCDRLKPFVVNGS